MTPLSTSERASVATKRAVNFAVSRLDHIWLAASYRCHRIFRLHEECEPGCSRQAHCWKCGAVMPQTPEWDEWWIDEDGVSHRKAVSRKPYCGGAAERIGVECRFCAPSRAETHQATCRGLRDWWHVLSGEHVRLATWDWREAVFMEDRAKERVNALIARQAELEARLVALSEVL